MGEVVERESRGNLRFGELHAGHLYEFGSEEKLDLGYMYPQSMQINRSAALLEAAEDPNPNRLTMVVATIQPSHAEGVFVRQWALHSLLNTLVELRLLL